MKNLVLLELNELIFPYVERYIAQGKLPNFARVIRQYGYSVTDSEKTYENLEPWIQWVSAHTGRSFDSHKVFRLGDFVGTPIPQVFEILEQRGVSVGAISPMNAENRLSRAAFFVPDPWTNSTVTGAPHIARLYKSISRAVNENASSRISFRDGLAILEALARHALPSNVLRYVKLAVSSLGKPWRRALFLDLLLSDVFLSLFRAKRPQFSVLFLNAGAHVQHHYLFSSGSYDGQHRNPTWYVPKDCDPVLETYEVYDRILGELLTLASQARVIIATGLSQEPYPKPIYYYRLRNHKEFLRRLGIQPSAVEPRMSRDFLVTFQTDQEAKRAQLVLESITDQSRVRLFSVDNRGRSLFVTLSYESEIRDEMSVRFEGGTIERMGQQVAFVALKNGHHVPQGYIVDTSREKRPQVAMPITQVFDEVVDHFAAQR